MMGDVSSLLFMVCDLYVYGEKQIQREGVVDLTKVEWW